MMIDRLLEFSAPLKEAYPFFHELVEAFRDKDPDLFFSLLTELPETLDGGFREKLQNLLTYEEGITNVMIYPYSNGKIEAKNTHIKTMKRVSYGFKSFENMRIRIFLINQLINVREQKNLSQNVVHSDPDLILHNSSVLIDKEPKPLARMSKRFYLDLFCWLKSSLESFYFCFKHPYRTRSLIIVLTTRNMIYFLL